MPSTTTHLRPLRPDAAASPADSAVSALQAGINAVYAALGLPSIKEDGSYGPITHASAIEACWYLGVGTRRYADGALSVRRQRVLLGVGPTSDPQRQRAAKRRRRFRHRLVAPLATAPGRGSEFNVVDAEGAPSDSGVRLHAAKDWFGPAGLPVRSPVAGTVVEVRPSRGDSGQVFGGVVKVRAADGKVWVFRHVMPSVSLGDAVARGGQIATVNPWRDGPSHTHVELWRTLAGGYAVANMIDPMRVLR